MERDRFGRDVTVKGIALEEYLADLAARNDAAQVEIERGKLACSIAKQMNNRSRLLLDAAKFELKEKEMKTNE